MTSETWKGTIGLIYASECGYSISATNDACDTTVLYDWNETQAKNCRSNSWLLNSSYAQ